MVLLRDCVLNGKGKRPSWSKIADQVVNLQGERPFPWLVADVYKSFHAKLGRVYYDYENGGKTALLATPEVKKFLVRKLLMLRGKEIVTTALLQRVLVAEKNVELDCSYIGKILKEAGYTWLPKSQKPKYTKEVMIKRLAFAKFVLSLSDTKLRERLSLSLDGVVLTVPPNDSTDLENYCRYGTPTCTARRVRLANQN